MKKQESNPFEGLEALKVIDFEEVKTTMEEKLLFAMKQKGIKVQSVFLPPNFELQRNESSVIKWLRDNIKSLNTTKYELQLKYSNI
jgi:hypothetical protein